MDEVVAGSPINFLDQALNIFVVDSRGESTHKPQTPRRQLPPAVVRLLPPLIVVSALLGGLQHHRLTSIHRIVRISG